MSRRYRLHREQTVRRGIDEVFEFFSNAENLEALTPTTLNFEIQTPGPIEIRQGTLIDYQIRLFKIPVRWQTLIEEFEPGRRFVDVQLKGPYRYWRHTHEFRSEGESTVIVDTVEYEMPFGPLGRLVHWLFVRRTLRGIFDFRRQRINELFDGQPF